MSNDYRVREFLNCLTNGQVRSLSKFNGIELWGTRPIEELLLELSRLDVILGIDTVAC